MNNTTLTKWTLHDREVVLKCTSSREVFTGAEYIPADNPDIQIISGEYADGQPLSSGDFEELYDDYELCDYIEIGGCNPVECIPDISRLRGRRL